MPRRYLEFGVGEARYTLVEGPWPGDIGGWVVDPQWARWELPAIAMQIDPRELSALLAEHDGGRQPDTVDVAGVLAERIASGRLLLVQASPARPIPDVSPRISDLVDPWPSEPEAPRSPPVPEPDQVPTYFSLRLVGESGGLFSGCRVGVRLPDGTVHDATLDEHSMVRFDDIVAGIAHVEGLDALVLNRARPPLPGFAPEDANARVATVDETFDGATGVEHTVVVEIPGPRCVRLVGMLFALNKAFLLPAAMEGIRLLSHMYAKLQSAELLAVGHTDATGLAWRNTSLSLQRAEAVLQFVTDDVEGWYAHYTSATDFSRRWGHAEDLAMLSVLPSVDEPYYREHLQGASELANDERGFAAAVRRFQVAKGLAPSDTPDAATRRALIADYMAIDGTSLPAGITATAHGCGQDFPAVPTEDDVPEPANRRVEIFMFPDGIDPAPPGPISAAGSTAYPTWNEAVVEERTFVPGQSGHGRLEVVTDIEQDYQVTSGVVFRLRSTDGAYEREMLPVDGRIVSGYTVLLFEDLPMGSFYSLSVRYASGHEEPLFEDIPYPELSDAGNRGVEDLIDPFAETPVSA